MPVVCGDENHGWCVLQRAEVARQLDAADARHLDIEQQHLCGTARQAVDHIQTARRFAYHYGSELGADIGQQLLQPGARGRLVVGDVDAQLAAHARPTRWGTSIRTR